VLLQLQLPPVALYNAFIFISQLDSLVSAHDPQ